MRDACQLRTLAWSHASRKLHGIIEIRRLLTMDLGVRVLLMEVRSASAWWCLRCGTSLRIAEADLRRDANIGGRSS